ncbi:hypothetical protein PtA15_1A736 [Puccinia triticina]|uniref:Uncharacterized protein n=1 Tax=Puccinia triticina TaxID=208348 RepID=A0ABY7CBZ7_9BASI|nr:uncharacterized protein PtA15_1A736 [Puccinia triticina]WAQ81395.1 hypothetical protein PtA15_1A736 [Puccinia triticina]WAR52276.1 hypothetical protein PtB15_1B717 [Puccinia triticina]
MRIAFGLVLCDDDGTPIDLGVEPLKCSKPSSTSEAFDAQKYVSVVCLVNLGVVLRQ